MNADDWWTLPPGDRDSITDVATVAVGHATLREGSARTGVTAVLPHGGNLFREKVRAGCAVLNGFGKSGGLVQVVELGSLETPLLLTNTFAVGTCQTLLVRRAIEANPDIGRTTSTVNPVVLECNDGGLNDIQALHVGEVDAARAIDAAGPDFARGTVGAGTGMSTFGFAGGIGSASCRVELAAGNRYTVGTLVLSNFGRAGDLRVAGRRVEGAGGNPVPPERGSIIVVLATDAPMDSRQLTRLCRRAPAALGRLGSALGHGSGDIAVAFSVSGRLRHDEPEPVVTLPLVDEARLDAFFLAAVESTERAVLDALWHAERTDGRDGQVREAARPHLARLGYPPARGPGRLAAESR